jgi:hypothetical protein
MLPDFDADLNDHAFYSAVKMGNFILQVYATNFWLDHIQEACCELFVRSIDWSMVASIAFRIHMFLAKRTAKRTSKDRDPPAKHQNIQIPELVSSIKPCNVEVYDRLCEIAEYMLSSNDSAYQNSQFDVLTVTFRQ